MKKFFKWLLIALLGVALLLAGFIWVYAPLRANRLSAEYEQFRAEHQPGHDAIDAQFHQADVVVDGIRWHYVDEGNPDGTVILFLHGLPEGWYSWSKVLPLVNQQYRLIAVDMKGYGRSDMRDPDYNWHSVASQTLDFMTSLGIDKFYVVSHDWGSIIGSVLVGDHPEHILGFVRMEADLLQKESRDKPSFSVYLQKPQWLFFQNNWIASYLYADAGWLIDTVYKTRMLKHLEQADRDYLVYEYSRPGVAQMNPKYFNPDNWDLTSAVGKICQNDFPFPVLQLQADSDPSQPPSIFAGLESACPHVQLEWVTGASHFDNFDQPWQVADAINRFVGAEEGNLP